MRRPVIALLVMVAALSSCSDSGDDPTARGKPDEAICASAVRLGAFLTEPEDPRQAGRTLLDQIVQQAPKARSKAVREAAGARGLAPGTTATAFSSAIEHLTETCGTSEPDVSLCTAARGWLEKSVAGTDPAGASTLIRYVIRLAPTVRDQRLARVATTAAKRAGELVEAKSDAAKRFQELQATIGNLATACDEVFLRR